MIFTKGSSNTIIIQESLQVKLSNILDDIEVLDRYAGRVIKSKAKVEQLLDELVQLPPNETLKSIEGIYNLYDFRMELLTLGVPVQQVDKLGIKPEPELNVTIAGTHKVMEMIYKHDEQVHRFNTMLETYKSMRRDLINDLKQLNTEFKKITPDDIKKYHLSNQQFLDLKAISQQLEEQFKS